MESMVTEVERSGDWMPAEELRDKSLSLLGEDKDITLNLDKIEYLDASAPQTLLAFDMEQKKLGQHLHLDNASPYLRQWFEFAGVGEQFALTERKGSK
jgi:anti-anti-sigma regulatory factor